MFKKFDLPLFLLSLIPLGYILSGLVPSIELTLIAYILLYLLALYRVFLKKHKIAVKKVDGLFYLGALIVLTSVLFSPNQTAGIIKAAKFIFLALSLIFFSRLFIISKEDLEKFFKYLLTASILTEYIVLVDYFTSGVDAFRYLAFGVIIPIPLAMLGATTTVMLVIQYFYQRIRLYYFVLALLPSVSMMTIAASKGPTIALVVTLLLFMPMFFKKIRIKHLLLLPIVIYLITKIGFVDRSLENLILRFIYTGDDLSTSIRLDIYNESMELFYANPLFGIGVGGLDFYPHNFFIEILAENGILLFLPVSALLVLFIVRYLKFVLSKTTDYIEAIIIALLSTSMISLMFSFTYVDHKYLFLSIGLLIVYNRNFAFITKEKPIDTLVSKKKRRFKRLVWN